MILKIAFAMGLVFIVLPLSILGFGIITHLIFLVYLEVKSDIEELSDNEKR